MASYDLDPKSGRFHIRFRYAGKPFKRSLKLDGEREAGRVCGVVEETLKDLQRGRLVMPEGADAGSFLISGGVVAAKPKAPDVSGSCQGSEKAPTVGSILDIYEATLTPGSKESNTSYTEGIHGRHFRRVLGADRRFDSLSVDVLQKYVNARASEGVVRDTIHKELTTLRVVWSWASKRKHLQTPLAWHMSDLTLPKAHEKPPFQTWDQITRKIERGGLNEAQQAELWECLWLDQKQTLECLEWVRQHAHRPFLYPMVAFAAYTGARRSEMLRSEVDDWDLSAGVVAIRQKKSDKSKSFTRRNVPIHPELARIMRAWFADHPGGRWTIAAEDGSPIGPQISTGYFRRLMKGGKWSVLHGWHTFRHSLASNMASEGIDQRMISEILGHRTEEMERRYRHLLPSKQEHALHSLFGAKPQV